MYGEGDDVGHCSNGLTQSEFRAATSEERVIYRRWIRGMVVFYCALLLVSGLVAFLVPGGGGSQVADRPSQQTIASSRAN